ncbi:MAG: dTMP kinase [Candidatus Azambacteria bacterium]|nr:dTMP kinase [Candidatus Azambacteria bacterium]
MFIALEGIDGSGKSTQTAFIVQWLETHGVASEKILVTREHTRDGVFGIKITKMLSGEMAPPAPLEFQKLYIQDRKDHLERVILPHMRDQDNVVICDRYFLSTLAYGRAGGIAHEELMALHEKILGTEWVMPDITLLIDVSAETATARLQQRDEGKPSNYFDTKKEFLQKAAVAYRDLAKMFSNVFIIDGEKPAEEVSRAIKSILTSQFSPCTKQS